MYETVKIVNGYNITRMKGTRGCYYINIREGKGFKEFHTFKTQKAAAAFAASLPPIYNSICTNCIKLNNGCKGETSPVFTGCVNRKVG